MDAYAKSFHLFCPGPVNVRAEVARALTEVEFCHREEEFSLLLDSVRRNALAVAGLADNPAYTSVVITGSGTAGNESVLASVVPDDAPVLVVANGEFGQRLAQISAMYNRQTVVIEHPWGEAIDLAQVERTLAGRTFSLVAVVHHETSVGILNPVEEIGALCARYGARLFVDAVSSYSADPLDIAGSHVTFMSTSAGKAIAAYPGLALVFGRRDAFEALDDFAPRNHYLDLRRYYAFSEGRSQTPNTPAVPLLLALNRALELALEEGMEQRVERLTAYAHYVRRQMQLRGLQILGDGRPLSNAVTSVELPTGVAFEPLRLGLREQGYVIYGGKGPFTDKIFQVSTFGDVDLTLIDAFFEALDRVLPSQLSRFAASA